MPLKAAKTQAPGLDQPEAGKNARKADDVVINDDEHLRDLIFELGLWVRGLEVYCASERQVFPNRTKQDNAERNYRGEFQITQAVLIRCSEMIGEINRTGTGGGFVKHETAELEQAVRTLAALNSSLCRNPSLNFIEWNAWCKVAGEGLSSTALYGAFDSELVDAGKRFLPEKFCLLLEDDLLSISDRADLKRYLPRFGGILRVLEIVKSMLDRDLPLRPALVIFAFIHEAINELNFDINNRLARSTDENAEIFGMLDAATYTLAMESKKAFSEELAAITGVRSATIVFARVESAYAVLNDSLRQMLTGFLRLTEPGVAAIDIFPEYAEKLDRSISLREKLWEILCLVRTAESEPTDATITKLQGDLETFLDTPISFLFYKDRETFERFCNEISITTAGTDAGPVLHRFSAYVETLFSQVAMRAVLQNHPFDQTK